MEKIDVGSLVEKTDLVLIAEQAGASLVERSGEYRAACPLHGGDNQSAFVIYRDEKGRQKWTCYSHCGTGDILDFVMKWQSTDFLGAVQFLGGSIPARDADWIKIAEERAARDAARLEQSIQRQQVELSRLREAQTYIQYHKNLDVYSEGREAWEKRGIPQDWVDFWKFGYCPEFTAWKKEQRDGLIEWTSCVSPSLTIPLFGKGWELEQVRHRLLNPKDDGYRYRPERSGLPAVPFMGDPNAGLDASPIFLVEGEIKAAATFWRLWGSGPNRLSKTVQVLGIQGMQSFHDLIPSLKGKEVFVIFDPGEKAQQQAREAAKAVNGFVMYFPVKVDDAFNQGLLDFRGFMSRMRDARRVL